MRHVLAAARLDVPAQVAYQLKLLTTAFFTVTMLKRHISLRRCRLACRVEWRGGGGAPTLCRATPASHRHLAFQPPSHWGSRWFALGLLFFGVVLVQSPKVAEETPGAQSAMLGMTAVAFACLLSGLAGVWLERIVKRTTEASLSRRGNSCSWPSPVPFLQPALLPAPPLIHQSAVPARSPFGYARCSSASSRSSWASALWPSLMGMR